jgi:ribonuclease HII
MEKMATRTPRRAKRTQHHFKKNYFETQAWDNGQIVCGLDEVGRGCLAGPVVTAAVILPPYKISRLLKDSKLMTPEERLAAYAWIEKHCLFSLGIVHHRMIDDRNIWQSTLIAMKKALVNLLAKAPKAPSAIVVDAMPLNLADTAYNAIPVHNFPFGERKSSSIAAASIVAKVKRDAMMQRLETVFPGYYLGQHKGYSTQLHKNALKSKDKRLIIHRQSFLKNLETIPENDQISIWHNPNPENQEIL